MGAKAAERKEKREKEREERSRGREVERLREVQRESKEGTVQRCEKS